MQRIFIFLIVVLLGAIVDAHGETYTVEEVIDCATLKMKSGEIIRLAGITCPENKEKAEMARGFVQVSIRGITSNNNIVECLFDDPEKSGQGNRVAYVFLPLNPYTYPYDKSDEEKIGHELKQYIDGKPYYFLNASIIFAGYCLQLTDVANTKYAQVFNKFYTEAEKHKRGIWSDITIPKRNDKTQIKSVEKKEFKKGDDAAKVVPRVSMEQVYDDPSRFKINMMTSRTSANKFRTILNIDALAKSLNAFSEDHNGQYPVSIEEILSAGTKYLKSDFVASLCGSEIDGYKYQCSLCRKGYLLKTVPVDEKARAEGRGYVYDKGTIADVEGNICTYIK